MVMTRNPTREWEHQFKRPASKFYQCELTEKIFCQKLITTLTEFNHIQGKITKTRLANVKRIFQGNNYLVLIG